MGCALLHGQTPSHSASLLTVTGAPTLTPQQLGAKLVAVAAMTTAGDVVRVGGEHMASALEVEEAARLWIAEDAAAVCHEAGQTDAEHDKASELWKMARRQALERLLCMVARIEGKCIGYETVTLDQLDAR